jgi:hypothetical protein
MKHVQAAGITVLAATMALTGCGGSKSATRSGAKASLSASAHARPGAAGATTMPGTVRPGAYCSIQNAVGKTADGSVARCAAKAGQTRKHWVVVKGAAGAQPGRFCTRPGAAAKAPDGTALTCTKKSGQQRARWTKK